MCSLPILVLYLFFTVIIQARPSQMDESVESDLNEADYGSDDKADSDDTPEDASLNDDTIGSDMNQNGRLDTKNAYSYDQRNQIENRADRSHSDFSNYYRKDIPTKAEATNNNYDEIENHPRRRQPKYTENKDISDQEAAQHLTNRNVNYYKSSRVHNNILLEDPLSKRETASKESNEQGDNLFVAVDPTTTNEFNNEPQEPNQRFSKYYMHMHPDNKEVVQCKNRDNDHPYFNRDRRETKDSNSADIAQVKADKESDKSQNEDEETAIRRHIKMLSSAELNELFNSLSEDKRQLLKSIIDDTDLTVNVNDNLKKREITKKAGAVEESNCVESGQSDSSNIQSDVLAVDTSSEVPVVNLESKKVTEAPGDNTKSTETNTGNKAGVIQQNDENLHQKPDDEASVVGVEKTSVQIVPSEQVTVKNDNKRETNLDDLADVISFEGPKIKADDDQGYFYSQDEDLSQFLDNEQEAANDCSKVYKRDVEKLSDYDAKMKSLEESFPKSMNYDESAGPLIRVKRKKEPEVKKRSVLPEAKVAFLPYRAENDDEDNDEGNEFDDDGFYDRTPNFSSNNANPSLRDVSSCKLNKEQHILPKDVSQGATSLGSDTDSVLSGLDVVDENLLLNSGSRNRRKTEDISDVLDESNSIHNSKSLNDETKVAADMNALTYQESDSFGPLPGNNEGDSGRYKRIRRVKQSYPESISSVS